MIPSTSDSTLTYSNGISRQVFVEELEARRTFCLLEDFGHMHYCIKAINQKLGTNFDPNNKAEIAKALGWPEWLIHIEGIAFGNLPISKQKDWPIALATAIPEGVDLNPVLNRISARILRQIALPAAGKCSKEVCSVINELEANWVDSDRGKAWRNIAKAEEAAKARALSWPVTTWAAITKWLTGKEQSYWNKEWSSFFAATAADLAMMAEIQTNSSRAAEAAAWAAWASAEMINDALTIRRKESAWVAICEIVLEEVQK